MVCFGDRSMNIYDFLDVSRQKKFCDIIVILQRYQGDIGEAVTLFRFKPRNMIPQA